MIPIRHHDVLRQTIKKHQINEDFAEAIILFYYKDLRKRLTLLKHVRIEISGLGYFEIKHYRLKYAIRDVNNLIGYYQKRTDRRSKKILKNLVKKKILLERIIEKANLEQERKEKKKTQRKDYVEKIEKSC